MEIFHSKVGSERNNCISSFVFFMGKINGAVHDAKLIIIKEKNL